MIGNPASFKLMIIIKSQGNIDSLFGEGLDCSLDPSKLLLKFLLPPIRSLRPVCDRHSLEHRVDFFLRLDQVSQGRESLIIAHEASPCRYLRLFLLSPQLCGSLICLVSVLVYANTQY